ncbi:hypothetical protein [Mycolicibacterium boenickei]|nr:hypothetical protein [Mycolicibacterium boenickei]
MSLPREEISTSTPTARAPGKDTADAHVAVEQGLVGKTVIDVGVRGKL